MITGILILAANDQLAKLCLSYPMKEEGRFGPSQQAMQPMLKTNLRFCGRRKIGCHVEAGLFRIRKRNVGMQDLRHFDLVLPTVTSVSWSCND